MTLTQYEILVSLASKNSMLSYEELMSALMISTEMELEDFIIQTIYQDIIQVFLFLIQKKLHN